MQLTFLLFSKVKEGDFLLLSNASVFLSIKYWSIQNGSTMDTERDSRVLSLPAWLQESPRCPQAKVGEKKCIFHAQITTMPLQLPHFVIKFEFFTSTYYSRNQGLKAKSHRKSRQNSRDVQWHLAIRLWLAFGIRKIAAISNFCDRVLDTLSDPYWTTIYNMFLWECTSALAPTLTSRSHAGGDPLSENLSLNKGWNRKRNTKTEEN